MKRNIKLLSLLALSFVIIFSSCDGGGGDDPSPEDARAEELSATWVIVSTSENTDFTEEVTINFSTNLTYTVSNLDAFESNNLNHGPIFSESGDFSIDPENTDLVSLTPGGDLTIMSINKENGNLSVSYTAPFPKATDDDQTITLNLEIQ